MTDEQSRGERGMSVVAQTRPHGTADPAVQAGKTEKTDSIVRVRGLSKRFQRADGTVMPAVDGVSFDVARGEFLVLLGPSGCGKTTLLRAVAGLETPDEGTIEIDGQMVYDHTRGLVVPPEKRRIGMIFQSYALWPHMTVAQNVAYPLQNRAEKLSKARIAEKVKRILDFVHIGDLAGQYPGQMSGGQQQRVALARALVAGNDLVLFDEPLSNVDARVREQLRVELVTMQRELGFSAIYVTHDQQEAMGLAHRIAVMGGGRFAQLDAPRAIYHQATSRYVADFVGTSNEVPGRVSAVTPEGVVTVDTAYGPVQGTAGPADLAVGDEAIALFRPERATFAPAGGGFVGTVEAVLFLGPHTEYTVRCDERRFRVWSNGPQEPEPGDAVWIAVATADIRVLKP
ncbi:ABC transporter ATP-binding protein [Sphaerimonospora sp. CA-214678]|uniref:ABC transporter ATP-binding protein n=1 Tax=Sphaerimonospora sp. CA-214678 TaxID=3240029 RepID=UPI003D94D2B1